MKEFEKKFGVPHGGFEDCDDWKYNGLEEGWKAALEWAKKQTGTHYDEFDKGVTHIRVDLVNKELEGEQ